MFPMQKICRFMCLKKCIRCDAKHFFGGYSKLQKTLSFSYVNDPSTFPRSFSTQSPCPKELAGLELLKEFPEPKKLLWRIINEAYIINKNPNIKPSFKVQQIEYGEEKELMWQVTLSMSWPEKFEVEGVAKKKSDAEIITFLNACQKLKNYGFLDVNNKPTLPEQVLNLNDKTIKVAKGDLCNIYQRIWVRFGRKDYIPKFNNTFIDGIFGKENYWKSELVLNFPEEKSFEGCSVRLREAESIAAAKALHWLQEKGIINKKKRLILYSQEEEEKLLKLHSAPYSICIPKSLQDEIECVLDKVETEVIPNLKNSIMNKEDLEPQKDEIEVRDVITDAVFEEPSEEEISNRSREMFEKNSLLHENHDPSVLSMKRSRMLLPIAHKREDILHILNENQVVVLSGETGCGKTTQVPQYILDDYISKMKGARCNIVVTQPRRISAISIAERVASERGEKVGETIGHHVRLNKNLPEKKGAILYCSTGMLLRKLCSNPNLDGVSHVIVDEVHERNIQIDFLLILLKRLIENNKDIKLLLMSASFNTFSFSQYFKCPVIHIPGKVYPVKEYFLEDLKEDIPGIDSLAGRDPILKADLVASVINRIHTTQGSGAILCFLPGWHEILTVKKALLETRTAESDMKICCVHSRLPHDEQKLIFQRPPKGTRKVILATNIAETSITVDDVVFVVNSGLHKGTSFDGEHGIASLGTQWITKANVRQRRGRAGRVQSGVCYNLFTRKVLMEMDDYPMPELLRVPLESVILDCKLYCPDSKAEEFLSLALQPPSRSSLQIGVNELQMTGILDENENLTALGKVVVNFATHPRLSIALVYGAFLGCLDPILTICAILTYGKEPFVNTLEEKSIIKEIKQANDNTLFSDHLALAKIFDAWMNLREENDTEEFVRQNLLDEPNLNFIKDLKALFAEDLYAAGIINSKDAYFDPQNQCNINKSHVPSIFAALTAAFYPNVIKLTQGEINHGRLNKDTINYSLLKGQKGYIQKESVASNEHELPSPWFIYFSALQSEARRLMMTSAISAVPGICLLLFAGQNITIHENTSNCDSAEDCVTLMLDYHKKLTFSCTKKEAELLVKCRNNLQSYLTVYFHALNQQNKDNCKNVLSLFYSDFYPILKEIISSPHIPFIKGHSYKFVSETLIAEEL